MPSKTFKKNSRLGEEWIEDSATRAAIQNINRRFQDIEKRLNFPIRRISDPCPLFVSTAAAADWERVPGLEVSIPTAGESVLVGLQFSPGPESKTFFAFNGSGVLSQAAFRFLRDGTPLPAGLLQVQAVSAGISAINVAIPPSIWFLDQNLTKGAHLYQFEVWTLNTGNRFQIAGVQLAAISLR